MTAFQLDSGQWAVESAAGYIFDARFPDQAAARAFIATAEMRKSK